MKDRIKDQEKIINDSDPTKKNKLEMESKVWVPDPEEGFVLGLIQDISCDEATVMKLSDRKTVKVAYDSLYPSGELISQDYDDNCSLMYLNEGSLLNNLRIRYDKDKIYTYVANILIAINPYFDISNLYSASVIEKYRGKSLGTLPPHLFALADKGLRDLKCFKQNQSIIVSGESGSGKTESTKYVLRYLCSGQHANNKVDHSDQIEKLILEANPVLEAFGNSKTIRNNNSSRFGKFIEIHYNQKIKIVGGHISHYLLEKSRIITQSKNERNYHIFYFMLAGMSKEDLKKLNLTKPENYNYLKNGCTRYFGDKSQYTDKDRCSKEQLEQGSIQDPIVNDLNNFKGLEKAFANFKVSQEKKDNIYRIVAAVLHLGNIEFEEALEDTRGGCRISASSENSLHLTSSLIKIEPTSLKQCLLTRVMQTSKGGIKGTVYLVPLKSAECRSARDALAKALYSRLFDYIITEIINKSLPYFDSSYYIGALDIAGFEYFQTNCFEQLLINYTNERLQQFFNERVLKEEQRIYESECLQLKQIEFQDNSECLQLIEKQNGILQLLDEESKLPKSSYLHYTEQVHLLNKNHFNLQLPRKSELKIYRNLRDDEGFIIRHFAGAVCYQTRMFLEKNNDALHNSLQCLMLESNDELVKKLFTSDTNGQNQNGKLQLCSVSGKFKQQLAELMQKLNSTGTHFIRCVKPNQAMCKKKFEGSGVLNQLRCSGMGVVMKLMYQGYPSRTSFAELYKLYEDFLPKNLRRLDPRMFSRILFKAIGLNTDDYKFGLTKVFFKSGKFAEFDQLIKNDPEHLAALISKVQKFLIIARWKTVQWGALSVIKLKNKIKYRAEKIVIIQKHLRMGKEMVKYRPLLKGLLGLRKLFAINEDLLSKANQLKDQNERNQIESQLNKLKQELVQFQSILKANQISNENSKPIQQRYNLRREFVDQKLREFRDQLDDKVSLFKHKMNEQIELIKMQKKLEEEQKKLEAEEAKRREDEEKRRKKEEIEARRLKEEEELNRRDALIRQELAKNEQQYATAAVACSSSNYNYSNRNQSAMTNSSLFELTDDIIQEDNLQRKRLEQEKLDHDLAMKLASEMRGSEMDRKNLEQQFMLNMRSPAHQQRPPVNSIPPLQVSSDHLINGLRNINLKPGQELDLSKWKYSDLRDVINTSCDLFLLECCKKEFHRRLKVYHSWKMKNSNKQPQQLFNDQRAPESIMRNAQNYNSNGLSNSNLNPSREQRFFRVPFVKSSNLMGEKGCWYAHFDGNYIARQLEIHPNKSPLLLIAGVNDMEMCELSLEETRLTSKRGAEILKEEFEDVWRRNGGPEWKYK